MNPAHTHSSNRYCGGEAMTTPFDELQAYCGPKGPGCRKPCPEEHRAHQVCRRCNENSGDAGTVLDTEHPLFQALWQPCTGHSANYMSGDVGQYGHIQHLSCLGSVHCNGCNGAMLSPRSHAEAALRLWDAVFEVWPDAHVEKRHGLVHFLPDCVETDVTWIAGKLSLPAAVLAALKAKEGVKP